MSEPKTAQQHNALLTGSFQEFPASSGFLTAPLPPTAEQTSIARFNALANEIRELRDVLTRHDSHANALHDAQAARLEELSAKLDRIDMRGAHMKGQVERNGILLASLERRIPPRAVAKKKAAPLVGKKGTGRKG